jgi:hypothetical protein
MCSASHAVIRLFFLLITPPARKPKTRSELSPGEQGVKHCSEIIVGEAIEYQVGNEAHALARVDVGVAPVAAATINARLRKNQS